MANDYFQFKQFTIFQDQCAFKVGTDGVILGAAADVSGAKRILDIGAGTGLVSIMLAQRSEAAIVAIEPDGDSFLQLSENVKLCKWADRIEAVNTKIQDFHPSHKFDLIVSNPPYFTDSLRNPDKRKSNARHNHFLPHEELLQRASDLLEPLGKFQVIMPYAEGSVLIAEAAGFGFSCNNILKIRPLPTSDIIRMVLGFSRKKQKPAEKFLTIEHGRRHEFTEDYVSLTKDFYLKF